MSMMTTVMPRETGSAERRQSSGSRVEILRRLRRDDDGKRVCHKSLIPQLSLQAARLEPLWPRAQPLPLVVHQVAEVVASSPQAPLRLGRRL